MQIRWRGGCVGFEPAHPAPGGARTGGRSSVEAGRMGCWRGGVVVRITDITGVVGIIGIGVEGVGRSGCCRRTRLTRAGENDISHFPLFSPKREFEQCT